MRFLVVLLIASLLVDKAEIKCGGMYGRLYCNTLSIKAHASDCFNNTAYSSEFYGPISPEASQTQAFTFLVRDQRLGINVGSAQGPIDLGKYLMHSLIGEVIFGGETMRFWDLCDPWLEPLPQEQRTMSVVRGVNPPVLQIF
ncbi:hypothetical protein Ahy_A09g044735 [Arachis hypogaea]|uniref:Uncharacterized protein n=1 Tax=Arachis hypogaea TaxID=3818 RepID=A0A445BKL8_ARAHY|nr:hypothetical protein Ahy_A09g044735 [Arachis hypogaea]